MTADCGACGVDLSAFVERITGGLLAGLDGQRRAALADTYGGTAPTVLCAGCFNVTVSALNVGLEAG